MQLAITGISVVDAYNAFCVDLFPFHVPSLALRVDEAFRLDNPNHPVAKALVRPARHPDTSDLRRFGLSDKEIGRLSVKHREALLATLYAAEQANGLHNFKETALVVADSPRNTELHDLMESGLSGKRVNPYTLLSFRPDYLVDYIGSTFGMTGPGCAVTASCASGAYALDHAIKLLEAREVYSALILSMSTPLSPQEAFFFHTLGAMSSSEDRVCRPFDVNRSGLVLAEGCAAIYIERLDEALARGTQPLAIIEGVGTSSDGEHITAPSTTHAGAERALKTCLKNYKGDTVDLVVAHAAGTPVGDLREMEFLSKHFPGTATTALKGYLGHHVHNSALLELCYAVEMLQSQTVPPIAHLETAIDGDLDLVRDFRNGPIQTVLKPSFGFGGKNGIVLLSKPRI